MMLAEMEHSSHDGSNRAALELPIRAVGELFTFHSVFLVGEREGDVGCCSELVWGRNHYVREMEGTDLKFDVSESKGVGSIAGGIRILPRAK